MPLETIAFKAPIQFQTVAQHGNPYLNFFISYATIWQNESKLLTIAPTSLYAESCVFIKPDNSMIVGVDQIWPLLKTQYGQFAKTAREPLSLIMVSDPDTSKHELHLNIVLSLYRTLDAEPVKLLQSFVYEIGEADEGAGTDGLQIKKL